MSVPFLVLSRRVAAIRDELDAAIAEVLDDGPYVLGPGVEAFEADFAAYCGAAHAIGVASGTDAITIALLAVGVEPGDEVITTSNSGVPTVAAIEAAGATPVLVDVHPATRTLDPARLADAVGSRTRAIVPVHLYGRPADMAAIGAFAAERELKVVEDAAQAVGAELGGVRTGALADAAAFSFYPTKNLGALGDGGAVVTNDAAIAERVRMLRNYGESARYHSVLPGRNSRLDPLQAAALRVQLRHLDMWNERRLSLAAYYDSALADTGLRLPSAPPHGRHAYHLYVVETADRDDLRQALDEEGVSTLVHYPEAVHVQPAYAHLAHAGLSVSARLCAEVVSLPLYPELTDGEAEAVANACARWRKRSTAE